MLRAEDLILSGRLGGVTRGVTRDVVQVCFGEPEDVSVDRNRHGAFVWKYGDIQVGFDGDSVGYVAIYLRSAPRPAVGGGRLVLDSGLIRGDLSVESFTTWLSERGCAWRVLEASSPDCRYIETVPGVHTVFLIDHTGSTLDKVIAGTGLPSP